MTRDFWLMIALMVLFSYVVMSNIMLTYKNSIYNHVNKIYMALLMGALMGVVNYILMIYNENTGYFNLLIWVMVSIVLIVLIRKQLLINEQQFLESMIEHHDAAIFMSERIIEKTHDEEIKQFASNIIKTQQPEIDWMKMRL
jgi:hypothetical protein